jgi:LytS/YehU family sensor histidine kinase
MRSRHWLQMPLRSVGPRIAAGTALAGALLAAIAIFVNRVLLHTIPIRDLARPRYLFVIWASHMTLMVLWMAVYLAIHEFRHRRITEVRALRLELVAQQAQLRGLRAQINPHFLFNCLNSLRELIVENPHGAQMMVTQISGLLRYSLQSNHTELVRLADEVQAVKDYLDLEGVRLEERLQVYWNIASDLGNVPIPPMLLQTLVENALKHGISRRPAGGEITIGVRSQDFVVELEVVNTGELSGNPSTEGLGLRNAQERLQLLYGDKATIVLESAPNNHVRAAITLPLQGAAVSR